VLVISGGDVHLQVESLRNILGCQALRAMAVETGFSQRSSKLTPEVFFDLLFYAVSLSQNSSLEYLVSYLESKYDIKIRKQSLDDRFSERAVNFVKSVLGSLICTQFSNVLYNEDFLSEFTHVRIKDSTKFNVPSNLEAHYKGCGGSGSTACICIQYEFDLKTGKFLDLTITQAVRNDQQDAKETVEDVCKNDLVIRDLGYFSIPVLQKINEKEAFFLSKLPSHVLVYDENGVEIDFEKLYSSMTNSGTAICERQVFIGKDKVKVAVRLIIGLVPPEVYQERLRRREKEEKRKGRQTTERTKFLLHLNLFVTNVEENILPSEKVMPLYRFRWQVELMFKNWKSVFSIHTLQKMKKERYITMLYTRLILIIVNLQITNHVQSMLSKQEMTDSILSYPKTLQTLKNSFFEILSILRCEKEKAIKLLEHIYRILSKNHWREKRKERENYVENIGLFICISQK
jgi:IS4 transposase